MAVLYAIEVKKEKEEEVKNINYTLQKELKPLYIFNPDIMINGKKESKTIIFINKELTDKKYQRVDLSESFYGYRISASFKDIPQLHNVQYNANNFYINSLSKNNKVYVYLLEDSDGYVVEGTEYFTKLEQLVNDISGKLKEINNHGKRLLVFYNYDALPEDSIFDKEKGIKIKRVNVKRGTIPNLKLFLDLKLREGTIKLRNYEIPKSRRYKKHIAEQKNITTKVVTAPEPQSNIIKFNFNNVDSEKMFSALVAGFQILDYKESDCIEMIQSIICNTITDDTMPNIDKAISKHENIINALKIYKKYQQ
jgi:hypothetical protein